MELYLALFVTGRNQGWLNSAILGGSSYRKINPVPEPFNLAENDSILTRYSILALFMS